MNDRFRKFRKYDHRLGIALAGAAFGLAALGLPIGNLADEVSAPQAAGLSQHPLLQELNQEVQGVYHDIQGGIVRVQLPPPKWVNEIADRDDPMKKWGPNLSDAVKKKLEEDRKSYEAGVAVHAQVLIRPISAATKPGAHMEKDGTGGSGKRSAAVPASAAAPPVTGEPGDASGSAAWKINTPAGGNGETIFESSGDGGVSIQLSAGGGVKNGEIILPNGGLTMSFRPTSGFTPNFVGMLLDDAGHIVVPMYVEKESVGEAGVAVSIGNTAPIRAKFVGSDRQTNLTILQIDPAAALGAKPVIAGANRPADGSLILLVQPNAGVARLQLWTGGQQDYGIAVSMDGAVMGFVRYGQFLSTTACKPIADQLASRGEIKRPQLGIELSEVDLDDPVRAATPALSDQPALCISDVMNNSLGAQIGLCKGDLILGIHAAATSGGGSGGDEKIGDPPAFAAVIASHPEGFTLKILRSGKPKDIAVQFPAK